MICHSSHFLRDQPDHAEDCDYNLPRYISKPGFTSDPVKQGWKEIDGPRTLFLEILRFIELFLSNQRHKLTSTIIR